MSEEGESVLATDQTDSIPYGDQERSSHWHPSAFKTGMAGEPIVSHEDFHSDNYKMDNKNRGRALIINNRSFNLFPERKGTDQDAMALCQQFIDMGFEIAVKRNLSVDEMKLCLKEAARDDEFNVQSDCFVCAILTYGKEGVVYGSNGKVEVKQLLEPFKGANCKGLVGKPKIFFIQACPLYVDATDAIPIEKDIVEHKIMKIPSEADFLIAYSVVPGFLSWQNSANGSWFIQALSEVLAKNWKDVDLLTMMTRVNKKFAYNFESPTVKKSKNPKKQIPCITSLLTKVVRFTPKD